MPVRWPSASGRPRQGTARPLSREGSWRDACCIGRPRQSVWSSSSSCVCVSGPRASVFAARSGNGRARPPPPHLLPLRGAGAPALWVQADWPLSHTPRPAGGADDKSRLPLTLGGFPRREGHCEAYRQSYNPCVRPSRGPTPCAINRYGHKRLKAERSRLAEQPSAQGVASVGP